MIVIVFYKDCSYWRGCLMTSDLDLSCCRGKVKEFKAEGIKAVIVTGIAGTIPYVIPWWKMWMYKKVS